MRAENSTRDPTVVDLAYLAVSYHCQQIRYLGGKIMKRALLVIVALTLTGCGVAYQSAAVRDRGDANVRVVPLTPETVLDANRSSYDPQRLPEAFSLIAGAAGQPRGIGALPDPVLDPQQRPVGFDMRLPEPSQPRPYVIGVGDVILLSTPQAESSVEALSGLLAAQTRRQGYTVQDDGAISIPDIGRIVLGGLTLEEAEDAVFRQLVEARIDPAFSLEVAEFNSQRVSVGGAVVSPGTVPIALQPLYLDQAISRVGGIDVEDASFAMIRLYRNGSLYQLPVDELFSENGLRRILLRDGDSIFVDTTYNLERAQAYFAQQITLLDLRQSARTQALQELQLEMNVRRTALEESRSNFTSRLEYGAIDRDYVYIIGEVGAQSRFALPFENSAVLADALLESGGVTSATGNPGQIYVLRGSPDPRDFTSITALHLDATNATNFLLATRLELRPGDVIFVAAQPITSWNRVITQIIPSASLANALSSN